MDKREEIKNSQIERWIQQFDCDEQIYHYTSLNALRGILINQEFWLGNVANMNDKHEVKYLVEEMHKEIMQEVENIKHDIVNNFFEEIYDFIENNYQFAACFSKLNDNAAQWERYADYGEGVCIEFNIKKFMSCIFDSSLLMNNIYYAKKPKENKNYDRICFYIENGYFESGMNKETFIIQLVTGAYLYKHSSFCSEEEIRICTAENILKHNFATEFEFIDGRIRKIVKISLRELCDKEDIDFEDLIDGIVIGPRSKQNICELKEYAISLGYSKLATKIRMSDCPLR